MGNKSLDQVSMCENGSEMLHPCAGAMLIFSATFQFKYMSCQNMTNVTWNYVQGKENFINTYYNDSHNK